MVQFLRGFLSDITGDAPSDPGKVVFPWKFNATPSHSSLGGWSNSGFDVLDGVPSDGDGEEADDFLFEVSETPHLPTFRLLGNLPGSRTKAFFNCLRLCDVLKQKNLTRDEFSSRFGHIEILSLPRHEFESSATYSQLLTGSSRLEGKFGTDSKDHSEGEPSKGRDSADGTGLVAVVRLDDDIRAILGIETMRLR
jgi:hypothetical protein